MCCKPFITKATHTHRTKPFLRKQWMKHVLTCQSVKVYCVCVALALNHERHTNTSSQIHFKALISHTVIPLSHTHTQTLFKMLSTTAYKRISAFCSFHSSRQTLNVHSNEQITHYSILFCSIRVGKASNSFRCCCAQRNSVKESRIESNWVLFAVYLLFFFLLIFFLHVHCVRFYCCSRYSQRAGVRDDFCCCVA